MTTKAAFPRQSKLMKDMIQSADYLRSIGGMDAKTHEKITLRQIGPDAPKPATEPMSAEDVRRVRQQAHMSQAVFARYLNVSLGYVSQLERGAKRPVGTALVLLNVIRRKGLEAIL